MPELPSRRACKSAHVCPCVRPVPAAQQPPPDGRTGFVGVWKPSAGARLCRPLQSVGLLVIPNFSLTGDTFRVFLPLVLGVVPGKRKRPRCGVNEASE